MSDPLSEAIASAQLAAKASVAAAANVGSEINAIAAAIPPPVIPPTPSPYHTEITAPLGGSIIDGKGNVLMLVNGNRGNDTPPVQISLNGVTLLETGAVTRLAYIGGAIIQTNSNGDSWSTTLPAGATSANWVAVPSGGPPSWAVAAGMTNLFLSDDFSDPNTIDLTGTLPPDGHRKWWNISGNAAQILVGNGLLTLLWKQILGANDKNGVGCGLQTVNKANQGWAAQYFAVEFEASWDVVDNTWIGLWAFPVAHNLGTDNGQGMEADCFESGGAQSSATVISGLTTLHTTAPGAPQVNPNNGVKFLANPVDFNSYGMLWVKGKVTWFINGVEVNSYDYGNTQPYWDGPNNLLFLVMDVDGWPGHPNPDYSMRVRKVSVWTQQSSAPSA